MSTAEKAAEVPGAQAAAVLMLILISDPLQAMLFVCPAPVLTAIKQHFDTAGLFGTQMIMSAPGLGIILGGWPAGRLIERFGALPMLAVALPAYALCGAAGLVVDSFWTLILSRLLLGGFTALIAGSALTLVAEADVRSVPRLLSAQAALGALTGLVVFPLAGWLGETHGWRGPFSIYLITLIFWAAAVRRLMDTPASSTQMRTSMPRASTRHLWPLLLVVVFVFAAIFMRGTNLPFILAEAGLTRPMEQAWTLTFDCLANVLGALSFAFVAPRVSSARRLILCLITFGIGCILLGASSGLAPLLVSIFITAAAGGFAGPCLAHMLLNRAGRTQQRAASGLLFSAIYLGEFINPMATGLLHHAFDLPNVMVAMGCICLAACAMQLGSLRMRHIQ